VIRIYEQVIDSSRRNFKIGKAEILEVGDDVAILACGTMVKEAQIAANILREKGINETVADFLTVKPIDKDMISDLSKKCKMVVTVEEHSVVNGFGSVVADVVAPIKNAPPLYIMGVKEGSKTTGPYREVLDYYSLTCCKIADNIITLYKQLDDQSKCLYNIEIRTNMKLEMICMREVTINFVY